MRRKGWRRRSGCRYSTELSTSRGAYPLYPLVHYYTPLYTLIHPYTPLYTIVHPYTLTHYYTLYKPLYTINKYTMWQAAQGKFAALLDGLGGGAMGHRGGIPGGGADLGGAVLHSGGAGHTHTHTQAHTQTQTHTHTHARAESWQAVQDAHGRVYYHCPSTGATSWEPPFAATSGAVEQGLQRHPEAGSSWPSWPQASPSAGAPAGGGGASHGSGGWGEWEAKVREYAACYGMGARPFQGYKFRGFPSKGYRKHLNRNVFAHGLVTLRPHQVSRRRARGWRCTGAAASSAPRQAWKV